MSKRPTDPEEYPPEVDDEETFGSIEDPLAEPPGTRGRKAVNPYEGTEAEPLLKMRLVCEQGRTGVSAASTELAEVLFSDSAAAEKAFSEAWQAPWKLDPAGSGWP